MNLEHANDEFGLPGVLSICAGRGDLPLITVDNAFAHAEISAHAGQVLSFRPLNEPQDLLFVSRQASFAPGKAIKGGIPVCWPWFGPDPEARGRPDHGFVRARPWKLLSTEAMVDGTTRLRLGISDDESTRALWPRAFALELEITIGETLGLVLTTHNPGPLPMQITQGLHTYFSIGDVRQAQVLGLAGYDYIDKVGETARRTQSGPINFDGPVNRIYLDTEDELIIDDPVFDRRIHIERGNSRSAVVWNPWIEQSRAMADFGDDEYPRMVCVETTNTADDAVEVAPGGARRLSTVYRIARD